MLHSVLPTSSSASDDATNDVAGVGRGRTALTLWIYAGPDA